MNIVISCDCIFPVFSFNWKNMDVHHGSQEQGTTLQFLLLRWYKAISRLDLKTRARDWWPFAPGGLFFTVPFTEVVQSNQETGSKHKSKRLETFCSWTVLYSSFNLWSELFKTLHFPSHTFCENQRHKDTKQHREMEAPFARVETGDVLLKDYQLFF